MPQATAPARDSADKLFVLGCPAGSKILCLETFVMRDSGAIAFTRRRSYEVVGCFPFDRVPALRLINDRGASHYMCGDVLRKHFCRPGVATPDDRSWISCRNGKWHMAEDQKPTWKDPQKSVCGLTFVPSNVTWMELPPTSECHICAHCRAKATRTELVAA